MTCVVDETFSHLLAARISIHMHPMSPRDKMKTGTGLVIASKPAEDEEHDSKHRGHDDGSVRLSICG